MATQMYTVPDAADPVERQVIEVGRMHYRRLNAQVRELCDRGVRRIALKNVCGQRYICAGIKYPDLHVEIDGTPGEDLAVFMDGPTITVRGNGQNAIGNTMNAGRVVVHGLGGDVIGYGMRGGRIYIRDNVGYRVGIHMKGYLEQQPLIVVGGRAGDFFGEYMAGGCQVVLGATTPGDGPVVGDYCAAGMHGGRIYLRGQPRADGLGEEVKVFELDEQDVAFLRPMLEDFAASFDLKTDIFDFGRYCKIMPVSARPYGRVYAY